MCLGSFLLCTFMIQIFMLFVDIILIQNASEVQLEAVFYAVLSGFLFTTNFYLVVANINLSLVTPASKTFYRANTFIHCFTQLLFSLDLT